VSRWARSAWRELWIEIPQVWFWLASCILVPWVVACRLIGFETWAGAAVCIPLGIALYVLTWGRPQ
jgi:hypothetical protein